MKKVYVTPLTDIVLGTMIFQFMDGVDMSTGGETEEMGANMVVFDESESDIPSAKSNLWDE